MSICPNEMVPLQIDLAIGMGQYLAAVLAQPCVAPPTERRLCNTRATTFVAPVPPARGHAASRRRGLGDANEPELARFCNAASACRSSTAPLSCRRTPVSVPRSPRARPLGGRRRRAAAARGFSANQVSNLQATNLDARSTGAFVLTWARPLRRLRIEGRAGKRGRRRRQTPARSVETAVPHPPAIEPRPAPTCPPGCNPAERDRRLVAASSANSMASRRRSAQKLSAEDYCFGSS